MVKFTMYGSFMTLPDFGDNIYCSIYGIPLLRKWLEHWFKRSVLLLQVQVHSFKTRHTVKKLWVTTLCGHSPKHSKTFQQGTEQLWLRHSLELIPTSPVNGCRFFLSRTEIRSWLAQHIRAARAGCQWKYVKTNVNLSIMEIDRCQIP